MTKWLSAVGIGVARPAGTARVPAWQIYQQNQAKLFETINARFPFADVIFKTADDKELMPWDNCRSLQVNWEQYTRTNPDLHQRAEELAAEFADTLQVVRAVTGDFNLGVMQVPLVLDNIYCLQYQNVELDRRFTSEVLRNMTFILNYLCYRTREGHALLRAMSSNLFNLVFRHLDAVVGGDERLKWLMLSAHDTNLINVLPILGLTNSQCLEQRFRGKPEHDNCEPYPLFASNLIVELHSINNQYVIKINYNGEYKTLAPGSTQISYVDWK